LNLFWETSRLNETMTEQKDLSNNPFAALLTGDVPVSYQNTKEDQEVPTSQIPQ
jgi:hypothetical protein